MLAYNLRIALKSLRRNPVLTAVIITGIALGICASTTFTTVRHMFARDPLPGKSNRVFYVRLDNWDPAMPYPVGEGSVDRTPLPPQITYRDAVELLRSKLPLRQTADYVSTLIVYPEPKAGRPFEETVRLCGADFFPMFDVPFQYGSGWDRRADAKAEQVVVIDDAMNRKLFGGANSIGKRIRMGDRDFSVVGVLAPWRPFIRMYDPSSNFVAAPEAMYIPFNLTLPMQLRSNGNTDNWKPVTSNTYEAGLMSENDFVQFWVELRTAKDRASYQRFVDDYVRSQKKAGRFPRPLNNRVKPIDETLRDFGVIRPQLGAMAAMSILFLIICALNLTGLLLAKFLARAPEVSVRRALGATRADIFLQHVVECELVGVAGGIIGILLSMGVMHFIGKLITETSVVSLDGEMVVVSVGLSLFAGLLAGAYPAWRICTTQPAVQLKV
jgi:putative ABC transport system permease protein